MRPPLSVTGTRCTRCTPDSYFSCAKTPAPADLGDELAKAAELGRGLLDHLPAPAAGLGEPLVHACEIGREERRLLAAGAGADLQDRRACVRRVAGQQRQPHRPLGLRQRRAQARKLLLGEAAHLGVGEQPLGLLPLAHQRPPGVELGHHRLQLGVFPAERRQVRRRRRPRSAAPRDTRSGRGSGRASRARSSPPQRERGAASRSARPRADAARRRRWRRRAAPRARSPPASGWRCRRRTARRARSSPRQPASARCPRARRRARRCRDADRAPAPSPRG